MKILSGRSSKGGVKGSIANFHFQKFLYLYSKQFDNAPILAAKDTIRLFFIFRNVRIAKKKLFLPVYY
jgi:hypothetical protein